MTGATQTRGEPPPTVLVDERAISAHVERIAGRITRDHPDGVVLVGVLKGALIFLADAKCCGESAEGVAARPGWDTIAAVANGGVITIDDDKETGVASGRLLRDR